ncbi:glycosyltransferase [Polaribacter sp. WD7]|uniref:glycosyltransferase n=1 Tax=Polaribacter sp. WD7 TaxID=2269061 RepID=UPI000DF28052|nr:glycosyltransferase [Polaribacter sp. WD7]RCS27697.1 glycosyltransferase [Polaribacter sp. WD7]
MKIAFILCPDAIISGNSNGIKNQALSWQKGLEKQNHKVVQTNVWGNYDWKSFDVIHIFGTGLWLYGFVKNLRTKNDNIVISPIIDSLQSKLAYKISTFIGFKKLRLWSPSYTLRKTLPMVKNVYVRSTYEAEFFTKSMGLSKDKLKTIFLNYDNDVCKNIKGKVDTENFCLHISSIYQPRKNVLRLIKAAKKYKFQLVLAGAKGTPEQFKPLKDEIGTSKNIEVLGFVTQEKMIELFKRAKVFALPSICEGVGIVALNAAYHGCEILITEVGGPKEYFSPFATLINPLSVDEIGQGVVKLLGKSRDNKLEEFIKANNSIDVTTMKLEKTYSELIHN